MKKELKRIFALLVMFTALFGFYSCDSTDGIDDKTDTFTLVVRPIELIFDDSGGELLVEVSTDYPDLVVTTDLDWLSAFEVPGTTNWKLIALQNMKNEEREGKVVVKAGTLVEEVTVKQLRREIFMLPFLAEDTSIENVKAFEESRNSTMEYEEDIYLGYIPEDAVWDRVEYEFDKRFTSGYSEAVAYTSDLELFDDMELFDDFMVRRDFTKVSTNYYKHNQHDYHLILMFGYRGIPGSTRSAEYVGARLYFQPKQDKAYPTWSELPIYPQVNHLMNNTGDVWYFEDVESYENGLNDGAVFDDENMPWTGRYMVHDDPLYYERFYIFYYSASTDGALGRYEYRTNDFDKLCFEHDGKYYITEELLNKILADGYNLIYPDLYGHYLFSTGTGGSTVAKASADNKILMITLNELNFDYSEPLVSIQVWNEGVDW